MAYVVETGSRRFVGSGGVVLVHVTLAYLLVFGLAAPDIIKEEIGDIIAVNVDEKPKPPPEKKEEQKEKSPVATPVHNPDPLIDLPNKVEVKYEPPIFTPLPPVPDPRPPLGTNDRLDAGLFTPTLPRPINNVLRWVTPADYPRISIKREEQGAARFSLEVSASGKVTGCRITRSSGSEALDQATCAKVTSRARFEPATDKYGAAVAGTYSNSVNWVLPE